MHLANFTMEKVRIGMTGTSYFKRATSRVIDLREAIKLMKLKPLAPAACARAGDDVSVRFIVRIFKKASLRRTRNPAR